QARENPRDVREKKLSQSRFAELLERCQNEESFTKPVNELRFSTGTVSNWERDASSPRKQERDTLCAIVTVLLFYEGLPGLTDVDELLTSGGYSSLEARDLEIISTQIDNLHNFLIYEEENLPSDAEQRKERLKRLLVQHKKGQIEEDIP